MFGDAYIAVFSAVLTLAILFLSEILPKTLGAVYWRRLAPAAARVLVVLIPLLWPLVALARRMTRLVGRGQRRTAIQRDEFTALAELGAREGVFRAEESRVLKNLFRLGSLRTKHIMTPRIVVFALSEADTVRDVLAGHTDFRFSRIPVYGDDLDDVTGYVLKDDVLLAIGIVASMFTALYVTHAIFDLLLRRKAITELRMRPTRPVPTISWTRRMRAAVTASAVAMAIGVVLWEAAPDKVRYDLDFTQGSKLILRFHEPEDAGAVRSGIEEAARRDTIYRDIAVRATAEGIGSEIRGDRSSAFDLRSQNVATEAQIAELKAMLREVFAGKLLPGPFASRLRASLHRHIQ